MVSFLLPTRGRPDNVKRFIRSVKATAPREFPNFEFLLRIDDGDLSMCGFPCDYEGAAIRLFARARKERRANLFDELVPYARYELLWALGGDDMVFRTAGWLERVRRHVADGCMVVYGRDGIQDVRLPTWSFVTREWIAALGHISPTDLFYSCYLDNWMLEVAGGAHLLAYDPEIFIEHLHVNVGKAPDDATYAERRVRDKDDRRIYAETALLRIQEVERLRAWARATR